MEEDEEVEETWKVQLKKTKLEAAGLTPEQANICMRHINPNRVWGRQI
jgi:hypothetical protein